MNVEIWSPRPPGKICPWADGGTIFVLFRKFLVPQIANAVPGDRAPQECDPSTASGLKEPNLRPAREAQVRHGSFPGGFFSPFPFDPIPGRNPKGMALEPKAKSSRSTRLSGFDVLRPRPCRKAMETF